MSYPTRALRIAMFSLLLSALPMAVHADNDELEPYEELESHGEGQKISIEGYGELHFNIPATGSLVPDQHDPAEADLHRMVWGLEYRFTDRVTLHSEIDFEHAATEIELEEAYIDYMVNPWVTIRGGAALMPIGPLNESHAPTYYYSVERPQLETVLIPTTWTEAAAGVVGQWMGVRYRMYLTSGLNAANFTADTGIRDGRGKVAEASSSGLAYAGRVEYVGLPGVTAGASAFVQPDANQRTREPGALDDLTDFGADPGVRLFEGDLRVKKAGFELQGVVVYTRIKDAEGVSTYLASLSENPIGTIQFGWLVEGAYHLLTLIEPEAEQDVVAFVRYESFDTQAKMPSGFVANPANNRQVLTAGVSYLPLPPFIAVKADYERWKDESGDHGHRVNLGLAYLFF